jgi:hypothetical protein
MGRREITECVISEAAHVENLSRPVIPEQDRDLSQQRQINQTKAHTAPGSDFQSMVALK